MIRACNYSIRAYPVSLVHHWPSHFAWLIWSSLRFLSEFLFLFCSWTARRRPLAPSDEFYGNPVVATWGICFRNGGQEIDDCVILFAFGMFALAPTWMQCSPDNVASLWWGSSAATAFPISPAATADLNRRALANCCRLRWHSPNLAETRVNCQLFDCEKSNRIKSTGFGMDKRRRGNLRSLTQCDCCSAADTSFVARMGSRPIAEYRYPRNQLYRIDQVWRPYSRFAVFCSLHASRHRAFMWRKCNERQRIVSGFLFCARNHNLKNWSAKEKWIEIAFTSQIELSISARIYVLHRWIYQLGR